METREESDLVAELRATVEAAQEAKRAAEQESKTPERVRTLTARALEAAQKALTLAERLPSRTISGKMQRQTFAEFTQLLGEEVKEAAEESVQEGIKHAERNLRKVKSLIEDHFHIDEANFRMLGPLQQDANLARDVHDWFNLVALVPLVITNAMNWVCQLKPFCGLLSQGGWRIPDLWHGEAFLLFWTVTFSYFVLDLVYILLLPDCVRSPKVIMQHHLATIAYIFVPLIRPEYGWIMGSCMSVEVNTWFLIARRSFNKKGDKMFTPGVPLRKSLRLLTVSSCFYVSWFVIRLGFYPYLLIVIVEEWYKETKRVGSPINIIAVTPVMQCVFIFLNVKWTVDLVRSKLKSQGKGPAKGL